MIIRNMDVLIYGPFQLITGFPTKDVDVQRRCSTTMVLSALPKGSIYFLIAPKQKPILTYNTM